LSKSARAIQAHRTRSAAPSLQRLLRISYSQSPHRTECKSNPLFLADYWLSGN
jgi:hypothetical protein